ncbi:MAG: hypothetical protein JSU87_10545 [Gemmatimonadota bacterium]|nr:MAG: hypothetical protein JSU87_10545 [Gemmatimonadota bacterium]
MRGFRLAIAVTAAAIAIPATAYAQSGVTPLMTGPHALSGRQMEFRGYVTIEDDIDLFGVFRRGLGQQFDFGLRAGFTDAAGGGLHLGGDLRYGLARGERREEAGVPGDELPVGFALVAGLQLSFADLASLISVPIGVSIGTDVGNQERSVVLYGLPFVEIDRVDPEVGSADTELEFGVELGGEVELTRDWIADLALVIASHDNSNISLALGMIYRR